MSNQPNSLPLRVRKLTESNPPHIHGVLLLRILPDGTLFDEHTNQKITEIPTDCSIISVLKYTEQLNNLELEINEELNKWYQGYTLYKCPDAYFINEKNHLRPYLYNHDDFNPSGIFVNMYPFRTRRTSHVTAMPLSSMIDTVTTNGPCLLYYVPRMFDPKNDKKINASFNFEEIPFYNAEPNESQTTRFYIMDVK